jgi:hypothetical protein
MNFISVEIMFSYCPCFASIRLIRPKFCKDIIKPVFILEMVAVQYLLFLCFVYFTIMLDTRRPFEKFVDSPYYTELELCGGAVMVSFSKYLHWQAMHFLQRSTHFSKTSFRPLITLKLLALEFPFHGWKSPRIAQREIWTVWQIF